MVLPKFDPIRDVLSGMLMAVTSIPQLIAYAETVGYAGHIGLSTSGPPLLAWGLVTGSPWTNAGVTSLTAMMARNDLNPRGEYVDRYGESEYVYLVSAYSLCVGVSSLLLAMIGLGNAARGVPESIRVGFKWGCEVGILTSAFPHGLYYFGYDRSFLENDVPRSYFGLLATNVRAMIPSATGISGISNVLCALTHPWTWDVDATVVFVNCIIFIMISRKYVLPRWMPHGSEVLIATALATLFGVLTNYAGGVVGEIPSSDENSGISLFDGLVKIPIELLDVRKLSNVPIVDRCFDGSYAKLLASASVFSAINYLSIVAISTGFERDDGIPWSATRELLAQGASNVIAGIVGSAPVSGSMSRSLVSRMTGSTSKLACIVTALLWMCMMPYMSIMSRTPKAALCAVVVSAVITNVVLPTRLLSLRGPELFVGLGTALASSVISPTMGFVFGCVLHASVSLGMKSKEIKSSKEKAG
ncbi:hypothetical protein ACHAXA_010829 [Cyclostephanos tholiformis]|uniref:SLC26A/SulP transporter domain-containing protein n=1 Tax=Cyclostephanos tholiformis TaxID=382380 RepID=A0ABD3SGS2_9STRA